MGVADQRGWLASLKRRQHGKCAQESVLWASLSQRVLYQSQCQRLWLIFMVSSSDSRQPVLIKMLLLRTPTTSNSI